jgi:hypothetical protein
MFLYVIKGLREANSQKNRNLALLPSKKKDRVMHFKIPSSNKDEINTKFRPYGMRKKKPEEIVCNVRKGKSNLQLIFCSQFTLFF